LQDNSVFDARLLQLWYQPFAKHVVVSLSSNGAVKEERAKCVLHSGQPTP
jgi:hypothetical protein